MSPGSQIPKESTFCHFAPPAFWLLTALARLGSPMWAVEQHLPRLYRGVPCSASLSLVRHAVATVTGLSPSAALPAATRSRAFSLGVPDRAQHMCSACMEDGPAQGHTEMLMLMTEPQLHPHVSPAKFSMEESRACRCTQKAHTRTRLSLKQGPSLGC